MGERNYLIEGLSGSGKTTAADELGRRGYQVIHGDRVLAFTGDPETGKPLDCPDGLRPMERLEWLHKHWIWPVERVKSQIADQTQPVTFFCGGSRNHSRFLHLFDGVFVLDVGFATLNQRLVSRPEGEFGGQPTGRRLIARLHKTRQDLPRAAIVIDASAPPDRVVDEILSRCALNAE